MARKQEQPTGYVVDPKLLAKLIKQVEDELTIVWPKWRVKEPLLIKNPEEKALVKRLLYQYKALMTQKKYIRKEEIVILVGQSGRILVGGTKKPSTRLVRPVYVKKGKKND